MMIMLLNLKVKADSYMFIWEEGTTYIEVPLNANILDYINKPKAKLYRNDDLLSDANIVYNPNGDWLYLLTDVDTSIVGDYMVWYKLSESNYKPGQCKGYKTLITFHVVDKEAPKIIDMPVSITYRIGNPKPNYLDWVTVIDNSGNCSVKVNDDNVDYKKVGSYYASLLVTDGFNPIKEEILVNVIDEQGPRITYLGDSKGIIIPLDEEAFISDYFRAIDDVDGDVTYTISHDYIDTSVEGKFNLTVSFSDLQGNVSSFDVVIQVIDESVPTIVLQQESLLLDYETDFSSYDFKNNIYSAYDGKKDITDLIEIDISSLLNEVGVYSIYYKYYDKGVLYCVTCKVHLLSNKTPVISTQDVEIIEGQLPDYSDYIDVSDPSDITILESTQIDDSKVNYGICGTYPVYVTVTNSSGLSATETLFVTVVEEKEEEIDWKMIIIGVMMLYFIGSKVLDFIKSKRI